MSAKTIPRSPAFPPVLTSYKLLEIERIVEEGERGIHQGQETRVFHRTGRIYACSRDPVSCHTTLSLQTGVGPYRAG
jgi:hypothetical protein